MGNVKILGVYQKGFDDIPLKRLLQKLYSGQSYNDTATSSTFSPLSDLLEGFSCCSPVNRADAGPPTILPASFFAEVSCLVQDPAQ